MTVGTMYICMSIINSLFMYADPFCVYDELDGNVRPWLLRLFFYDEWNVCIVMLVCELCAWPAMYLSELNFASCYDGNDALVW